MINGGVDVWNFTPVAEEALAEVMDEAAIPEGPVTPNGFCACGAVTPTARGMRPGPLGA